MSGGYFDVNSIQLCHRVRCLGTPGGRDEEDSAFALDEEDPAFALGFGGGGMHLGFLEGFARATSSSGSAPPLSPFPSPFLSMGTAGRAGTAN